MARYYFHLWTGKSYEIDDVGLEFETLDAAYLDACTAITEMSREMEQSGVDPKASHFEIMDQRGRQLFELPFVEIGPRRAVRPSRALKSPEQLRRDRGKLRSQLRDTLTVAGEAVSLSRVLIARSRQQTAACSHGFSSGWR